MSQDGLTRWNNENWRRRALERAVNSGGSFGIKVETQEDPDWLKQLEADGHFLRQINSGDCRIYHLTEAGQAEFDRLPKLESSQC
jgi:DNA-binding PadR family transcriptional regulator